MSAHVHFDTAAMRHTSAAHFAELAAAALSKATDEDGRRLVALQQQMHAALVEFNVGCCEMINRGANVETLAEVAGSAVGQMIGGFLVNNMGAAGVFDLAMARSMGMIIFGTSPGDDAVMRSTRFVPMPGGTA